MSYQKILPFKTKLKEIDHFQNFRSKWFTCFRKQIIFFYIIFFLKKLNIMGLKHNWDNDLLGTKYINIDLHYDYTIHITAWKGSKYGVISGPYFPVFGLNTGKYRQEITLYLETFDVGHEWTGFTVTFSSSLSY